MEGKALFKQLCREKGIECDVYFKIGQQNSLVNEHFVYRSSAVSRKPTQRYAINYIKPHGIFVAWEIVGKKETYNYFIVSQFDVQSYGTGLQEAVKALEYSGHGEETVYLFNSEAIDAFLAIAHKKIFTSEHEKCT